MKYTSYSFIKIYHIYYQAVHCLNLGASWPRVIINAPLVSLQISHRTFYIKIKRGFWSCFRGLHEGWRRETGLSPPVKYFYWRFQGGTSFVDHLCYFCLVFVMLSRICLLMPCGHLLGMGWPHGSHLWCLIMCLSLSHVVSWVRCGTWLYRFLIFALFLTFPSKPSLLYGLLIL